MGQIGSNDCKAGMKLDIDGQPYLVISIQLVKPGKGQAFCRVKIKNLYNSRVIEKTFKSSEKLNLADVQEIQMRLLYCETDEAFFMDEKNYEQYNIPFKNIGETKKWLLDDCLYDLIFYKGDVISVEAPTFLEMKVKQTDPGHRGDTAAGRVLKPATMENGAEVQVPIFIGEGELLKIDTRKGEYVSRVKAS